MWKGIQIGTGAHCRQIPPGATRVEKESPGESRWEVAKAGNSMSMTAGAAAPSQGAEDKTRNREDGGPIVDNFSTLSSPTDWGEKRRCQLFLQEKRRGLLFALRAPLSE